MNPSFEQMLLDVLSAFPKMSLEQWLALSSLERSALAGGLAGNFARHHSEECYYLLQQMFAGKAVRV